MTPRPLSIIPLVALVLSACSPTDGLRTSSGEERVCITYNGVLGAALKCKKLEDWIQEIDSELHKTSCAELEWDASNWKAVYGEEPKYWQALIECRKNPYAEPCEQNGILGWCVSDIKTPQPDKKFCQKLPCP